MSREGAERIEKPEDGRRAVTYLSLSMPWLLHTAANRSNTAVVPCARLRKLKLIPAWREGFLPLSEELFAVYGCWDNVEVTFL